MLMNPKVYKILRESNISKWLTKEEILIMMTMSSKELMSSFFDFLERDLSNWNIEKQDFDKIKELFQWWSKETQKAQNEFYEKTKKANEECLRGFFQEELERKNKQVEDLKKIEKLLKTI